MGALKRGRTAYFLMRRGKLRGAAGRLIFLRGAASYAARRLMERLSEIAVGYGGAAGRLIPLFPLCGDTATGQRVAAGRL